MRHIFILISVLCLLILTINRNNLWQDDLKMWEDVIKKSPGKVRPYINLAGAYLMKNRLDDALSVLFKSTEVFRDEIMEGNIHYLMAAVEIFLNFAAVYGIKGDMDRAMEFLQKAYETNPQSPKVNYALAYGFMEKGDLRKAEEFLKNALSLAEEPKAYFLYGELCERQGRLEEAIRYFKRATELEPENSSYLTRLGYLLKITGKPDEAERAWLRAIRLTDKEPEPYVNLGSLMYERGFLKSAYQYYKKALEIDPNNYEALVGAANVIDDLGNFALAREMYEKAIKVAPERKEAYIEYERSLKRQGKR